MDNLNKEISAVIMIGGQSKRMGGGIKSLITFNNKSIFDRIPFALGCGDKPKIQDL